MSHSSMIAAVTQGLNTITSQQVINEPVDKNKKFSCCSAMCSMFDMGDENCSLMKDLATTLLVCA